MQGHFYILASRRHGTLYVGSTRDLVRPMHEHRTKAVEGFTSRHQVQRLVHFETFDWLADASAREKAVKHWKRDWKIRLIEENNPEWADLAALLGFDRL